MTDYYAPEGYHFVFSPEPPPYTVHVIPSADLMEYQDDHALCGVTVALDRISDHARDARFCYDCCLRYVEQVCRQ